MNENPGIAVPDLGRLLGAEWKALSDDVRAKWNEKARSEPDAPKKEKSKSDSKKSKDKHKKDKK